MGVSPLGPAVNQGVAKGDQAICFAERGATLIERFRVRDDECQLILMEYGRPGDGRPEMGGNREHPSLVLRVSVGDMVLDLEVQFVDRRLEEGRRGKDRTDDVGAMLPDDVWIRGAHFLLLQRAGEIRQVTGRKEVVTVQARWNLVGAGISLFRRAVYRRLVGQ